MAKAKVVLTWLKCYRYEWDDKQPIHVTDTTNKQLYSMYTTYSPYKSSQLVHDSLQKDIK